MVEEWQVGQRGEWIRGDKAGLESFSDWPDVTQLENWQSWN